MFRSLPFAKMKVILSGLFAALALSSCSGLGAGPQGPTSILSRPDMQMDPSPLISALDDHIYFSKEASSGGRSFGGGGCGCN
ncbi:MAG: DUF4266 domain-containing protein [Akkermansiaceae bacterium]|jgi:hypothetical protein